MGREQRRALDQVRPALVVEREADARPGTILYFHGGGNIFGSPETSLLLTANLVVRTGFRAFSLDYRPAPEHPFPAGADDALNAYRALLDCGEDPAAIAFAGDSRGGHAVTACLAAHSASLDRSELTSTASRPNRHLTKR